MPAKTKAVGRPSSYRPEYAEEAHRLCLLGATDAQLAAVFGVSEVTINAWKTAHPEFLKSLKEGKEQADATVAKSLYQRAIGYEHDAVKIITVADGNNTGSHVEQVPYIERYPPETTAAIFWLKNRRPDLWRDKVGDGAGDISRHPDTQRFLAAVHLAITESCSPQVADRIRARVEQLLAGAQTGVAA